MHPIWAAEKMSRVAKGECGVLLQSKWCTSHQLPLFICTLEIYILQLSWRNLKRLKWIVYLCLEKGSYIPHRGHAWEKEEQNGVIHYTGCFFNCLPDFQYQNEKNLLSQRGAFLHWKFCEKTIPGWLQLVFHFGTENWADQLKKPPCRSVAWNRPNLVLQHDFLSFAPKGFLS